MKYRTIVRDELEEPWLAEAPDPAIWANLPKSRWGPKRIQRRRTKGWRMPPNAVYVGRPSRWANPYRVGEMAHMEPCPSDPSRPKMCFDVTDSNVVALYGIYVGEQLARDPKWLAPLRGKDLACWCPLDQPCHADVLIEPANV